MSEQGDTTQVYRRPHIISTVEMNREPRQKGCLLVPVVALLLV
jgi:hypothetical protein